VARYQTLASYTNITAPFNSIVTRRYVDPGVLVEAGTDTASTQPLLEVSDNFHLRLDFPVAQQDVRYVREGETISGTVQSLNGWPFSGKITRATWQVNNDTRTMTTEMEVNNPDLKLVPGMYASVLLPTETLPQVLSVPSDAVPPGETSTIFIVNDQDKIEERQVKLGIETSGRREILSGVQEGELALLGSRTAYKQGQKVTPRLSSGEGR
jgi:RND family efflux transporter MFP subunit